jgi:hypothetical protein
MQTKTIEIYSINELSEKAKIKAYNDWLNNFYYAWASDNEASLKAFAEIFVLKIKSFEYDTCNGNVSWDYNFYENVDIIENLKGVRLYKWIMNNIYPHISQYKNYWLTSKTKINPINNFPLSIKRTSKIIKETNCPLTGYCMDNAILQPILDFIKTPDLSINLTDLIKQCFNEWVKACCEDCERSCSMDSFIEECESNDYTFRINGVME